MCSSVTRNEKICRKKHWRRAWQPKPLFLFGGRLPWTDKHGGPQSMRSHKVKHNRETKYKWHLHIDIHTHWVNAILFVFLCYREKIISEKRHLAFLVYHILPNIPYCFSDAESFDEKLWNAQYFDKECSQIR